ncbi:MAG: BMP family ABC transporter substrate-binding protein [Desulfovibrio sp.]|nr:BMP family ABC transporter substrate-binding protein [Desulfovibrio sp.]
MGPIRALLLLLIGLTFLAISTSVQANPSAPLRVALLLEHNGQSTWTNQLKAGLERSKKDFGIDTKVVIESDEDKQEAVFRQCAEQNDLILVASDRFHEILRDNARRFQHVHFGCIDAGIRGTNITCITYADEQAAFLAGAAAALFADNRAQDTGRGKAIGWISGEDIAAMRSMFNGFREGAKLAVPDMRVIQGIAGSFANPEAAAKEAKRLITEGVYVLVLAAGASNVGALEQAKKAGIYVIGLDSDQRSEYPQHVLLSIVKNIDGAVYSIIRDMVQGQFKGKEIEIYDLQNGVSVTDPKTSLGTNAPILSTISRRLGELGHELKSGGIHLKSLRQRTLCNCL